MLNRPFTRILAKTCILMHVYSVFINPCTKKQRAQFSIRAELTRLSVCMRALQMCARETSHTACDCYFNNPERLICSPRAFGQSLYRVLVRKIDENARVGGNI